MSRIIGQGDVPYAGIDIDVPRAIKYDRNPKPPGGRIKHLYFSSTSGTALNPGNVIRYSIPNEGILMPGTYLNFSLEIDTAAAPMPIGGSTIIKRLEVRIGSQTITKISDYDRLYGLLVRSAMNTDYISTDGAITERIGVASTTTGANYYSIPILSSVLNAAKGFPLFLLSGPVEVIIELNSASVITVATATATVPAGGISDPRLFATILYPEQDYIAALRAMVSQTMLEFPCVEFTSHSASSGAGTGYTLNIGDRASSLLGILYGVCLSADNTTAYSFAPNGHAYTRIKLDGCMWPDYDLGSGVATAQNVAMLKAEQDRVFSSLFDLSETGSATATTFLTTGYVIGVSTQRFNEPGFLQTGTPLKANIELVHSGNTAGSDMFLYTIKDQVLLIDGSGGVKMTE